MAYFQKNRQKNSLSCVHISFAVQSVAFFSFTFEASLLVYENTCNVQRFGQIRFFVNFFEIYTFCKTMATIICTSHFYCIVDLDLDPYGGSTSFLPDRDRNPDHADQDPADSDRCQF
jgi:hypothetical protein